MTCLSQAGAWRHSRAPRQSCPDYVCCSSHSGAEFIVLPHDCSRGSQASLWLAGDTPASSGARLFGGRLAGWKARPAGARRKGMGEATERNRWTVPTGVVGLSGRGNCHIAWPPLSRRLPWLLFYRCLGVHPPGDPTRRLRAYCRNVLQQPCYPWYTAHTRDFISLASLGGGAKPGVKEEMKERV